MTAKECSRDSPFHCFLRLFFPSFLPHHGGKYRRRAAGGGSTVFSTTGLRKISQQGVGIEVSVTSTKGSPWPRWRGTGGFQPLFLLVCLGRAPRPYRVPLPCLTCLPDAFNSPSAGREAGPLRNGQKRSRHGPLRQAGLGVLGRGGGPRWASTQS